MPPTRPPRRPLALILAASALLAVSACSAPSRDALPGRDFPARDEVEVQGLTADQTGQLLALGVPVLVPGDPGAFELAYFEAGRVGAGASYALGYRRSDGACFELSGGNDGFGGPELPLVSTEARIADLGRTVRVYQAADVPGATSAQVWGVNTVVSEFVDLDGAVALFLSDTEGGCRPVSLEEGARIVSGLRLLTSGARGSAPTGTADLGAFAPAGDVLSGLNSASTPEVAAEAIARRYRADAGRTTVEVLSESSYEAVALVTLLDLRDDSVRDERLRLTYTRVGDTWELVQAGRQVRCQPGRGHDDWSDATCR